MVNNGLRELLEQMPTEQLDEMLQAELQKRPADGSAVRLIMRILEERERDMPVELDDRVRAAWEQYVAKERISKRVLPAWSGTLLRVASVIVLLGLLLWVVPQAEAAPSLWDRFLRLTESVFEFFAPGDTSDHHVSYEFVTDHPGLQQVYDAVVELGITDPVVPMWLPEGYELTECVTSATRTKTRIAARFVCFGNVIIFTTEKYSVFETHDYCKNEGSVRAIEFGGIIHNVMQNHDKWIAIWTKDKVECFLTGDCQEDDFYKILESIYIVGDE